MDKTLVIESNKIARIDGRIAVNLREESRHKMDLIIQYFLDKGWEIEDQREDEHGGLLDQTLHGNH